MLISYQLRAYQWTWPTYEGQYIQHSPMKIYERRKKEHPYAREKMNLQYLRSYQKRENTNNVEMSNFTEISEFKQTAELNANLVCTCRAETSKVMFFLNLYNPGPFIK